MPKCCVDAVNEMKVIPFLIPLFLFYAIPSQATVDPEIHKLCIEAKDYAGYIRAIKVEIVPSEKLILAISVRLSLRI